MEIIKSLHVSLAMLALLLFVWRGLAMWRGCPVQGILWRRILPDSVDTLLLISGIGMLVLLGLNPLQNDWLLAKLTAVLIYIGLGFAALRPGMGLPVRRGAFVAALVSFGYIVAVAHNKTILF
ncbi:MAG: SirB2 family protein [Mariprofundaceae bacterium]